MARELLRQVRLLDPVSQTDKITDVLIADGKIAAIDSDLIGSDLSNQTDAEVQDCTGLVLGTGLVDLYSHVGEPGFEDRETIASICEAAIAGGFTRLTLLPDTQPAIDNPAAVEWLRSQSALPQINCWGALTLGTQGEQMAEIAELAESGIVGFADGKPLQNWALVRRILEYGQALEKPIAFWCCDRALAGNGVVREGNEALRLGLPGAPVIAETAPLAALLECVETIGTPIHLMRISTARSVELIRAAKQRGVPITASTTWMHLLLDITAVRSYDPSLHLEPPLGNPIDRTALIQGLQDGVIDAIAIDHSPYTYEEKTVSFAESPPGAIGLELALPLLWQNLVVESGWSALNLWRVLSLQPAHCLAQPAAAIELDTPAELTLFDPTQTWQITPQTLKSRSSNTTWLHQTITGRVIKTWQP